jgi:hypothetical protein
MANWAPPASCIIHQTQLEGIWDNIQSRPSSANASRHMDQVKNNEAMVIGFLARQPHAGSSSARRDVSVVNPHIRSSILHANKAVILGCSLVYICNVSMCRISTLALSVSELQAVGIGVL